MQQHLFMEWIVFFLNYVVVLLITPGQHGEEGGDSLQSGFTVCLLNAKYNNNRMCKIPEAFSHFSFFNIPVKMNVDLNKDPCRHHIWTPAVS